jgi:hypothetical protein
MHGLMLASPVTRRPPRSLCGAACDAAPGFLCVRAAGLIVPACWRVGSVRARGWACGVANVRGLSEALDCRGGGCLVNP